MKKFVEVLEIVLILLIIFWLIFGIIDEIKKIKGSSQTINYVKQQNESNVLRIDFF